MNIVSAVRDTSLQVSVGSSTKSINLLTGQFIDFGETTDDITITSNKQVSVMAAMLPTNANGDLALVTILPFGQYVPEATTALTSKQASSPNAAKIIFTADDVSDFQLNNAAISWSWTGTTNKHYSYNAPSGVYAMSKNSKTKVAAAYTTGNVGSGMWGSPIGFRLAPLWESCTPTTATPGDNLDNDCDGRIDEEKKNGVDEDNDSKIDEDTIYEEPTQTNTNKEKRDDQGMVMLIILGATIGGITVLILLYLILRTLCCPVKEVTESKVQIIGSQAQITQSKHAPSA